MNFVKTNGWMYVVDNPHSVYLIMDFFNDLWLYFDGNEVKSIFWGVLICAAKYEKRILYNLNQINFNI